MADTTPEMSPALTQLVKRRARMTLVILAIIITLLTINMLLMTQWSAYGAKPLFEGSIVTIVLAYSIFVIFAGALLSGFYVWWANNVLDPLADKARAALNPTELTK